MPRSHGGSHGGQGTVGGWLTLLALAVSPAVSRPSPGAPSAPTAAEVLDGTRILYNNDGENLMSVTSSYHSKGAPINATTIRGTVRDVAGVADVDMICPFHNVPWWNSTLEPPSEHRDWYDRTFNFSWDPAGGSQLDYVLRGGDFVGVFLDESVKQGQKPFVTIRLNDGQMCAHKPTPDDDPSGVSNDHQFDRLSRWWWDHRSDPSYILGLQEDPPVAFRPCCWQDDPATKKPACSCPNAGCEMSWTNSPSRQRIIRLVGELAAMYVPRGLRGIELDFQRGLDYFPQSTPLGTRRGIMRAFLRDIRARMDAASPSQPLALGLRVTPSWGTLRLQGLDELGGLVMPLGAGGDGVTYLNWGTFFWAYQPFDSELASLAAATPPGTPFFYEVTSWTGEGPADPAKGGCRPPKVRITKEELWTTALLARAYGARGISAFNFVYTRPFFDEPCEYSENEPYSEPLFADLNRTRNASFLACCADQFYRLEPTRDPVHGQMGGNGIALNGTAAVHLRLVAVPPAQGWQHTGRLRLRTQGRRPAGAHLTVQLNGRALVATPNVTSLFPEGPQAAKAHFAPDLWAAWEVPAAAVRNGNNTVEVQLAVSQPGQANDRGVCGKTCPPSGPTTCGGDCAHCVQSPPPGAVYFCSPPAAHKPATDGNGTTLVYLDLALPVATAPHQAPLPPVSLV